MTLNLQPYQTIWFNPKKTIEAFLNNRSKQSIYGIPLFVYGISLGISIGHDLYLLYDKNPSFSIRLLTLAMSALIGIGLTSLSFGLIIPWLTSLTGKIWNGTSSSNEIANVYSLSLIPYCLFLPYQLILLITGLDPSQESINAGFQFILWLFCLRTLIIGISVTQNFNYGISLLNILLAFLPLVLIRLMIGN